MTKPGGDLLTFPQRIPILQVSLMKASIWNGDVGLQEWGQGDPQFSTALPLHVACGTPSSRWLNTNQWSPSPLRALEPPLCPQPCCRSHLHPADPENCGLRSISFGPLPEPCVLWKGHLIFVRQRILFTPSGKQRGCASPVLRACGRNALLRNNRQTPGGLWRGPHTLGA